jgi:hypothetical protein
MFRGIARKIIYLTPKAKGVKTYDNNMSPGAHKQGNEQLNAWLDADTASMVREIMAEYGLNKSDAARYLIMEGLKARGKAPNEGRATVYPHTVRRQASHQAGGKAGAAKPQRNG